ncbi:MAG: hypothetical protein JXR97_11230, partial [Planctomycetes bacterium]|nr:hypothetical protein [Planctomycetota bacterium]
RQDLVGKVSELSGLNPLSNANYVRRMYNRIAEESAIGLSRVDITASEKLSDADVTGLREVLKDSKRPITLREAVAIAFRNLKDANTLGALKNVFDEEDKANVTLRRECIQAINAIDVNNECSDYKIKALNDADESIQAAGSSGLFLANVNPESRKAILKSQRPNAPVALLGEMPAAAEGSKAEEGKAEEVKPEGKTAVETKTEEKTEEKVEEKTEKKTEETIW